MLNEHITAFDTVDASGPILHTDTDEVGRSRPKAPARRPNSEKGPATTGASITAPEAAGTHSSSVRLCEEEEIRAWCRRVTASNGFADFP